MWGPLKCGGPCSAEHVRTLVNPALISNKLTFDLESGVRVTCDVGYLCANFSLPRPLCSRLRPDDATYRRQTDVRQKHCLMPPPYVGGGKIKFKKQKKNYYATSSTDKRQKCKLVS